MIIKCERHGEVEADANYNGDIYCPQCRNTLFVEAIRQAPIDKRTETVGMEIGRTMYEAFKARWRYEDKPRQPLITVAEDREKFLNMRLRSASGKGAPMILKCEKHGEVEIHPTIDKDTHCPKCLSEALQRFNAREKVLHTDKAKPGTQYNGMTIHTADGAVLGSIQTFTPASEDRERLLKVGKIYELSEPRGPYSMGGAVQGHIPCKLGEPGQRAEGTKPEVKKEPSQYEQFLEDLKKADLIESYKMTGENTAEITMKYALNWLNKLGWSRIDSK
jgi:hypothetical protein